MKLFFHKYQGAGNDFVILDNRDGRYNTLTTKQIRRLCDRRFGIGGDGLMLLSKLEGCDFEMIYYNADGNESSMCGNGGRCLTRFAQHLGIHKSVYHFKAIDGMHESEIDINNVVRLKMQDVNKVERHSHFTVLNTGSPHFIKFTSQVQDVDVVETGRQIRNSAPFEKEGINVNFVESIGEDCIFVRTYERGVEDETLSCGTGVTAAALMCAHNDNGFNRVEVKTPGGKLSVEFEKIDDDHFRNIWLCGPAELVYTGEIEIT